jgi:purine-nucleoside phosphorylase
MTTGVLWDRVEEAVAAIRSHGPARPVLGVIMGTGLGSLGDGIKTDFEIGYDQIPHFPVSTVESHAGRLLFGKLEGKQVVAMAGRFHYYEGYTLQQVTFPIRVMRALGVTALVVSNACGGLNPLFASGDIMMITDHINLIGHNPLIGAHDERLGPRFPDMFECYDREFAELAIKSALELKQPLQRGVYAAVSGPNLETAAEYRFLRIIGADAVGMSTVPEVIVARQMGMRVLGFSIVTDMGIADNLHPANIDEIIAIARRAEPKLKALMHRCVAEMEL